MSDSIGLPRIQLDPNNDEEMLQQAIIRTQEASQGTITDFHLGSPARALLEGMVFGVAELLWFANQLPEATALEVFRNYGVSRSPGIVSQGSLTFLLSAPLASNFVVNAGYSIPYNDANFITQEQLVIQAGSIEGTVRVSCNTPGSSYNIPEYGLVVSNPPLNYLQAIYNPLAITGGTDLESLADTIRRGQLAVRSKGALVSIDDYQEYSKGYLGKGSKALCVPRLASDRLTYSNGQVHLFITDSTGVPANISLCQALQSELTSRSFAASDVWVDPMQQLAVQLDIVATVTEISETLANTIFGKLADYFSNYTPGDLLKISELMFIVRSVDNVSSVDSVLTNRDGTNLIMPQKWYLPILTMVNLTLIQPEGIFITYSKGTNDGEIE